MAGVDLTSVSRIILLHGASSAGKTTLSRAIQSELNEPFLHFASDHLAVGLPPRRDPTGPVARWSDMRPRFFDGFHRCIATLAAAGNDLIVEHVIEYPSWRVALAEMLNPFDVFLVGVHCTVDELERRERARGDRMIGEARSHVVNDGVHTLGPYDYEVETTQRDPSAMAEDLVVHWEHRSRSVLFGTASAASDAERRTGPSGDGPGSS